MEVAPASTTLPAMDPADVASAFMPACSDSFLSQDFGTQVRAQACMAVMESSGHSSWPPAESDSHPMEELPSVDQALEALPLQTDRKLRVDVEISRKPSAVTDDQVTTAVRRVLQNNPVKLKGVLSLVQGDEPILDDNVRRITLDCSDEVRKSVDEEYLLFWQIDYNICMYQVHEASTDEEPEDPDEEEEVASFHAMRLPNVELEGVWESLHFSEDGIKDRLVRYASSALHFSDKGVNTKLVSWNRVVLLFGPPGTGKTSLCKGVAQKLAIRHANRYKHVQLVEINAHSLFSKWFSESAKLVTKLFERIRAMVACKDSLVFVLIDEVESLSAARQAALSGSDPSDSIRVVNALLTQLDALKAFPNVVVLATSNITQAIDIAFIDRADIKAFIGPPSVQSRYEMLAASISELQRTGIVKDGEGKVLQPYPYFKAQTMRWQGSLDAAGVALLEIADRCEGLSGRALRKLPFLAHANFAQKETAGLQEFLGYLSKAVEKEKADRTDMTSHEKKK